MDSSLPERSSAVMVLSKSGCGGIVNDCVDLGGVIGEGLLERRQEVLRRDLAEGRRLERRLPGCEQRVGLSFAREPPFPRF